MRTLFKLALASALAVCALAQTPPYTTISDTLAPGANGALVNGTIAVAWAEFTYNGASVAQSPLIGEIYQVVAGVVNIPLVPTDHATSSGLTYRVMLTVGSQSITTYWSVPTLPSSQCASSSFCTIKEVTVNYPGSPTLSFAPRQISVTGSTNGQVLCNLAGVTGWCTPSSGTPPWSALQNPLANQALNMGGYRTTFTDNAGGGGFGYSLTNPNALNSPNLHSGQDFACTFNASTDTTLNVGFTAQYCQDINVNVGWGNSEYGGGTNAKITQSVTNEGMSVIGSGQAIMHNYTLTKYGMGDVARESTTLTYAGASVAGDEGRGFSVVSRLQQQGFIVKTTVSGAPVRSGCPNMTLSQAVVIPANSPPVSLTVTVTPNTTGCMVGDHLTADWNGPTGYYNYEDFVLTGITFGSITAVWTNNHSSGATVRPSLGLPLTSVYAFGQDRVLVDLSGASYTTGTLDRANNATTVVGHGTTWTTGMVGGEANSPGCGRAAAEDQTYSPFGSGTAALGSYWEIGGFGGGVNSNTSMGWFSFDLPGTGSYHGPTYTGSTYAVYPCGRTLAITGSTVWLTPNTSTWSNGDTVELAVSPYPDNTGFNYFLNSYTPGTLNRAFMNVANNGGQPQGNIFQVQNLMAGNNGSMAAPAFNAFLADGGNAGGSNPTFNYLLQFPSTKLLLGAGLLPSTSGSWIWQNTGGSIGTDSNGLFKACGFGNGGAETTAGCFSALDRVGGDGYTQGAMLDASGLQIWNYTNSRDAYFGLKGIKNGSNSDELVFHQVSFGTYGNLYGGTFELDLETGGGTENPLAMLGYNAYGNSNYGFWLTPTAAATSGTNVKSQNVGMIASVWGGSAQHPMYSFWDSEPDSNATLAGTHQWLYAQCLAAMTNSPCNGNGNLSVQQFGVGFDGIQMRNATGFVTQFNPVNVTANQNVNIANAGGNASTLGLLLGSGQVAMATSSIGAAPNCATPTTITVTGLDPTKDVVYLMPTTNIFGIAGYVPGSGGLEISHYITTNTININVCNQLASSVTPGALTLQWTAMRPQ
ncbi:MAG TPA: hypothetical protein VN841_29185 [Bryobacteraceae bacterium]|nr:hypothetical protein [Bryobacteraceae bacterium]